MNGSNTCIPRNRSSGFRRGRTWLALSGGGEGWCFFGGRRACLAVRTGAKTRLLYLVTGISTGAADRALCVYGQDYDEVSDRVFTQSDASDIMADASFSGSLQRTR